ncbi:MAG TPA: isoprenylcysteine carboxylmethyltransferase family protein [Candidatus Acidoferrales bacterium]|nr:isoprenylcysteine carboxylmethyltransferase family protein [Candidatus Acidoferrales bacterium]
MPASTKPLFTQTWFNGLRSALYACGFLAFFAWIALDLRSLDRNFSVTLPTSLISVGFIVMLAGAALAISCIATFVVRGRGTPAIFDPPRQFVAAGPYRYVRNPMYVGGFALLLGLAFSLRSISILLMTIVVVPIVHLLVVLYEEPTLKRKFDGPYENYLSTVARWLPRVPRTNSGAASLRP